VRADAIERDRAARAATAVALRSAQAPSNEIQVVAIDWSGAKARGGRGEIAVARCVSGELQAPRLDLSRNDVLRLLLAMASANEQMVVGLDFAFSLPAWFAREILGVADVAAVWEAVARHGERWLERSAPWPFWGRGMRLASARLPPQQAFRQTELELAAATVVRPKSVFQLVGGGQVGPASIRGMPLLRELRAHGFAVWPFDCFRLPLVLEIYPRALTGAVVKSRLAARKSFLECFAHLDRSLVSAVAATEHAFDAACSAIVMSRDADEFKGLRRLAFPYELEGRIWTPSLARLAVQNTS
jgi:hypothetical protein